MRRPEVVCWEILNPEEAALAEAHRLYETTLEPAERIPWAWIAEAVASRPHWRPGEWSSHLLVAAHRRTRGACATALGFAYGAHVPNYGGYICYLGVDAQQRGRGAGTRLLQLLLKVFQVDAACEGAALPFVVWESHPPALDAAPAAWDLWCARLRLFARVGAWWVSGLTFLAPDFQRRSGPPVPLQLFVIPVDTPREAFDADTLRNVAAGLHRRVYRRQPGDPLFDATLAGASPELRPVADCPGLSGSPAEAV